MTGSRAAALLQRQSAVLVITAVFVTSWAATPGVGPPRSDRSAPASVATKKPTPKLKLTPWEKALGNVSKDGYYSKKAALELFAVTYGPVPGVRVPKTTGAVSSGTPAIRAVMAHFDEYTAKQRRAIKRLIEPPSGSVTVVVPPLGQPLPPVPGTTAEATRFSKSSAEAGRFSKPVSVGSPKPPPVPPDVAAKAQEFGDMFRVLYAASPRLGKDMRGEMRIKVFNLFGGKNDRKLLGGERPVRSKIEPYDFTGCTIDLYRPALQNGVYQFIATVAHEVFHCFQDDLTNAHRRAGWIMDGTAEWASLTVLQSIHEPAVTTWWGKYLFLPTRHLFARTYDGIGFYSQMAQVYGERKVWISIPQMLDKATSEASFDAADLDDAFLDAWAPGFFRGRVPGKDWDITGPGITRQQADPVQIELKGEPEIPEIIDAYENEIYDLNVTTDAFEISGKGHIRISDGVTDTVVHGRAQFCTNLDGCGCPGTTSASSSALPHLGRRPALAISGGKTGAQVTLRSLSVEDFCCSGRAEPTTTHDLLITPKVGCDRIGLKIEGDTHGLKLEIGFALLVDHPRLRPHVETRDGKEVVVGLDLKGINGFLIDFGAGIATDKSNKPFEFKVPIDVEVPVEPRAPGLPHTMRVTWTVAIKTALTGDNATLFGQGQYALAGPLDIADGNVVEGPTLTVQRSLIDSISGISLGTSGIDILVGTRFTAGAGTPDELRGSFGEFIASFGVTNGASTGAPLVRCHGAALALFFDGGTRDHAANHSFFHEDVMVPDVAACRAT